MVVSIFFVFSLRFNYRVLLFLFLSAIFSYLINPINYDSKYSSSVRMSEYSYFTFVRIYVRRVPPIVFLLSCWKVGKKKNIQWRIQEENNAPFPIVIGRIFNRKKKMCFFSPFRIFIYVITLRGLFSSGSLTTSESYFPPSLSPCP